MDKTISFGKFKGFLWSELIKNREYCLWLLNQNWFQGPQRLFVQENVKCYLCKGNKIDFPKCPECQKFRIFRKF